MRDGAEHTHRSPTAQVATLPSDDAPSRGWSLRVVPGRATSVRHFPSVGKPSMRSRCLRMMTRPPKADANLRFNTRTLASRDRS